MFDMLRSNHLILYRSVFTLVVTDSNIFEICYMKENK